MFSLNTNGSGFADLYDFADVSYLAYPPTNSAAPSRMEARFC